MREVMGGGDVNRGGGELDLRALTRALWDRKLWILVPTAAALIGSFVAVNVLTPSYRSEARILVESGDNPYTRSDVDRSLGGDRSTVDPEAVSSQVQVIMSRDIARAVAGRLELGRKPEFDPTLRGFNPVGQALTIAGLAEDPLRMTAEERIFKRYYERLTAFQVERSRVIAIQFDSQDPELAARAANAVADQFLQTQQNSKRNQTRQATQWLAGEVEAARRRVEEAEGAVESFRARASLFVGSNNTSLTAQQLAEVNSQIASARAQQSDAQTRSRLLRDMVRQGRPVEGGDVVNSDIMRRLAEQRAAIRANLAELSSTLGPRHPRISELRSQAADIDQQLRIEAERQIRILENDSRIAGARVESLMQVLDQVKRAAGSANEQEVQLRVLERDAKSHRDQLEGLLARYRDATARDTLSAIPADARIVSRATVSNVANFPKKLPTVLIATLGTLMLAIGCVATLALMNGTAVTSPAQGASSYGRSDGFDAAPMTAAPALQPDGAEATFPTMAPQPGYRSASSVRDLAFHLDQAMPAAKRTLVAPVGRGYSATGVAVALGRRLDAQGLKVVMVDCDVEEPVLSALAGGGAHGLTDLLADQVSFAQVIHKDPHSRAHVVAVGRRGASAAALLGDERLAVAIEALAQTYDRVVIVVGPEAIEAHLVERLARLGGWAVAVSERGLDDPEIGAATARLEAVGLGPATAMVLERAEAAAA